MTAAGVSQMEWNGFKMVRKKAAGSLPLYSTVHRELLFHFGQPSVLEQVVAMEIYTVCCAEYEVPSYRKKNQQHTPGGFRLVRFMGRMKAEGHRWRDGAGYFANRGKEGWGEERREGRVKSGEQHPFYVEARAVGVPPFPAFAPL